VLPSACTLVQTSAACLELTTAYAIICFYTVADTSQPSPLSLHDALPISRGERVMVSEILALLERDYEVRGRRSLGTTRSHLKHRSEEHTSELQSLRQLVCRLPLETKNTLTPLDPRAESWPLVSNTHRRDI